jgi:metallo-beta-lactamase family protein
MKITFYGAAENVTGSKHLLETDGFRLLLDCGLYQGRRKETERLNRTLPFEASSIDAVILSHAHADHCGSLPLLVKNGFAGKIYATDATAEIAELIMKDSAKIQEEDASYLLRHRVAGAEDAAPIYTEEDVARCVQRFVPVKYFRDSGEWTNLTPSLRFKLYDAGHILGSSVIVVEARENGKAKIVAFTGDLGNVNVPLMRAPEPIAEEHVDALLMECTYGDRSHRPYADTGKDLASAINDAAAKNGKLIVPAFSLGRTQELIYALHKLHDQGAISDIPVYVDSPLAVNILDVFNRHTAYFDKETWSDFGVKGEKPFIFDELAYVRSVEESKALNAKPGPFMVISASGMCEGGRVRHHLLNSIGNPDNYVLITGYQAAHTLGRKIQEGMSPVNILGESREVKAKVVTLREFSAHADQAGLLDYLSRTRGLRRLFLVHTESPQDEVFQKIARNAHPGLDVEIPATGMTVEV